MKNNLPQKYRESFLKKIFNKIKYVFFKKHIENSEDISIKEDNIDKKLEHIDDQISNSFKEPNYKLKDDIKSMVENNRKLLKTLSYERLKQLELLYDEEIERNNKEIEYLNHQLEKVG